MTNEEMPRILLCHASEDKARVIELYHQLKAAGYHPWLDKYDLLPGQDWRQVIRTIITDPHNLIVVCLSCNSTTRRGVVQQEIAWALDVLDKMPEGSIYLIPARLEQCEVPDRLSHLHRVDLFESDGFEYLTRSLDFEISHRKAAAKPEPIRQAVQAESGEPQVMPGRVLTTPARQPFEPEMILIPAGEFLMGSDPNVDEYAEVREQPQHRLYLPDYFIAKTPVTNVQYAAFAGATNHERPMRWGGRKPPKGKGDHPVFKVSWRDAMAYCNWLSEVTGKAYRLPSEAEWEKGARGTDGWIYPWGNEWDPKRCNSKEGGPGDTTPVGAYPQGASPYGLLDMAGNVWEWTRSLWGKDLWDPEFKYLYKPDDGRENLGAGDKVLRVARGGSWDSDRNWARCACRLGVNPFRPWGEYGFRICCGPPRLSPSGL
jgi:formylglycine-generating enzyme required for sulfatase activity